MEDVIRWERDLGMIFDNYEDINLRLTAVATSVATVQGLADWLERTYTDMVQDAIDHVDKWEHPYNVTAAAFLRELCGYIPRSVFDNLAEEYWEGFGRG